MDLRKIYRKKYMLQREKEIQINVWLYLMVLSYLVSLDLNQKLANFICIGPDNEYLRLWGPNSFFLVYENTHRQFISV